ncbi:uncharacterized protein [Arachis hypogaea]|uniref:uncharacterized protein n=1 Tax=Arachis hypogaea TaxID=3818 RepID=UPI000DEC38E0|nr:uncharacterized protein LOC112741818 isoform X1 [Arachis hypogaea]
MPTMEAGEVAVFVDTNFGTRIAFNAFPHVTVASLKRDFARVHLGCLPDTGEIQVNGLMVKRKSCFYYLPDSLPIKHVFPKMRRTWFLHMDIQHLTRTHIPCSPFGIAILSKRQGLTTSNGEKKAICNSEEKRAEGFRKNYMQNAAGGTLEDEKPTGTTEKSQYLKEENKVENQAVLCANSMQGSLSKMPTQVISVSAIINKYFLGFNGIDNISSSPNADFTSNAVHSDIEVQSKATPKSCLKRRINIPAPATPKTAPPVLHAAFQVDSVSKKAGPKRRRSRKHAPFHADLVSKERKSRVGKRLLVASQSLGVSPIKDSPTLFCKLKDRNLIEQKSQINGSIFSLSDSDSDS